MLQSRDDDSTLDWDDETYHGRFHDGDGTTSTVDTEESDFSGAELYISELPPFGEEDWAPSAEQMMATLGIGRWVCDFEISGVELHLATTPFGLKCSPLHTFSQTTFLQKHPKGQPCLCGCGGES